MCTRDGVEMGVRGVFDRFWGAMFRFFSGVFIVCVYIYKCVGYFLLSFCVCTVLWSMYYVSIGIYILFISIIQMNVKRKLFFECLCVCLIDLNIFYNWKV